jgi:hypothetical protein
VLLSPSPHPLVVPYVRPRALESMARTIGRLATNPRNVAELVDKGAIEKLVAAIDNPYANADSAAATIEALNRLVQDCSRWLDLVTLAAW